MLTNDYCGPNCVLLNGLVILHNCQSKEMDLWGFLLKETSWLILESSYPVVLDQVTDRMPLIDSVHWLICD